MPREPVAVPKIVEDIAAGRTVVAVWENELGGVTFEIDGGRADLAIATLSLDWNFPTEGQGGFQQVLLDAYGVAADVDRIAYYRRAWDEEDPLAG